MLKVLFIQSTYIFAQNKSHMENTIEYLLLRIAALENENELLQLELHRAAMQILVKDPIFDQPIKK
jgi:hypothetical protein